jgi:hypothetical protein
MTVDNELQVANFYCATFNSWEIHDMTYVRVAFVATTAAALMAVAAPASAEIVATPDGQYYRLVPVRAPALGLVPEMVTVAPGQVSANVAPVSNCRLINFEDNEYQPEYTTVCGPQ